LVIIAIVGLPSIFLSHPPEPTTITVDILPISEMSNVKPREALPEPKKPEEKPKEKEQTKPAPPVKAAEAPPPPPAPKPAEIKKPEEKKKEPEKKPDKKEDKKTKPKEDDLAAILKSVKEAAQKEKTTKEKESSNQSQTAAKSERYDETMPMSLSEKDAIRSQIARCWNVPAGAKDAQDLIVTLHLQLELTGAVIAVELARDTARYNTDPFFRAAADSAMRAVRQCSPLQNLAPEKYGTWKDMELTFNPKDMLL